MKKGIFSLALASILCLSFVGMATACGDRNTPSADNGGQQGAEKTGDFKITVNVNDQARGTVSVSDPASATGYAKDEKVTLTVIPKNGYKTESVKANDDVLSGATGGIYTFQIAADTTVAVTFAEDAVAEPTEVEYPEDPKFNSLSDEKNSAKKTAYKGSYKAHDPVAVEARFVRSDGRLSSRYYAFSTDNDGGFGVQVRSSTDFAVWKFEGVAIDGFTNANGRPIGEAEVPALYRNSSFHLNEVYNWISNDAAWGSGCWTLWAPDVVPAADNPDAMENGHWWMYSCWTTGFGSERSIIFKLNANNVKGPYTFDTVIVRDDPENDGHLNEIDPSIYYSADGSRMFMSYGSFKGGFGVIELDPTTGHRKNATEADTVAGKKTIGVDGGSFDAEGSTVAYYERPVYNGDITGSDTEDASQWSTKRSYVMMGSDGALAYNYVMRTWECDTPDGTYTSGRGTNGFQVAGNWSWRHEGDPDNDVTRALNYYIPGHNDMLTTSDGRHLIVYHTRVSEATNVENNVSHDGYNNGEHYLYTSLFDFNSKGQLVINPNRYAGERICPVAKEDLLTKTQGKYSVVQMESSDSSNYYYKRPISYATDCTLNNDGTISGSVTGTWKLYGSHYIYIKIGSDDYYGTVMPAWIRQYKGNEVIGNGGLTISAVTEVKNNENKIIYFNMQF